LAGDEWVETKLLAPDGAINDLFGRSVGISGEFAVIGAHGDDDNGLSSGSAYIFRKIDGEWLFTQKLLPSDGAAEHRFGRAAAMDGELAIVGAKSHDSAGPNTGAAYVFRYDSRRDEWAEEAILIAGDADDYAWFGNSVAIDGEVALIGAYGEYNSRPGAAYVFEYQPASGEWIETAKLTASDGELNDFFGQSVAIDGDLAIIGADGDDDLAPDAGAAYIFTRDPGQSTWTEQRKLVASDGDEDDWFGRAVAVQGYIAVCGAPQDEDQAIDGGSAYAFDLLACLCTADVDGDGAVGVADLLAVLSGWGQPGGLEDVNRDGVVDVLDLLLLLASWGHCP